MKVLIFVALILSIPALKQYPFKTSQLSNEEHISQKQFLAVDPEAEPQDSLKKSQDKYQNSIKAAIKNSKYQTSLIEQQEEDIVYTTDYSQEISSVEELQQVSTVVQNTYDVPDIQMDASTQIQNSEVFEYVPQITDGDGQLEVNEREISMEAQDIMMPQESEIILSVN